MLVYIKPVIGHCMLVVVDGNCGTSVNCNMAFGQDVTVCINNMYLGSVSVSIYYNSYIIGLRLYD